MPARPHTPLAIVGMACRFPGGETLDDFWRLLVEGRSAYAPLPADRLNRELHFDPRKGQFGKTFCEIVGQVSQRPIDRRIIEIPDPVAARFDLTHLTLLETAAAACRHAGYDPLRLPTRNTGVYLGNSSVGDLEGDVTFAVHADQLAHRLRRHAAFRALDESVQRQVIAEVADGIRATTPAGMQSRVDSFAAHSAAGLITRTLGLSGPSLVTDAACAGSFTTLFVAAQALSQGTVDMAIVGAGACRSWGELVLLSVVQAMSSSGSRPFDADADGLITADGYGAVILKTLDRALADGDTIHGVIRGIGMSSDGKGRGFWAPLAKGQTECMRRAYAGGADPSRVQYIHAHATSTQLGDATEMESLAAMFGPLLPQKIPVTSVKANIGHTFEAAGMAGLIATLLSMKHATIPPAANLRTLNPEVPWNDIPFVVPTAPLPWPEPGDGGPRRAGIDAFGVGGLNTHVVLDDRPEKVAGNRRAPSALRSAEGAAHVSAPLEIAIIGAGCVLPGAHDVDAFRELIHTGRDARTPVPPERWDAEVEQLRPAPLGGFLDGYAFDWKKYRIPPFQVTNANPLQFQLLDAADQALTDAGYADREFDRGTVCTLAGAAFTNDFCTDAHLGMRLPEIGSIVRHVLAAHGVAETDAAALMDEYQREFLSERPGCLDETGAYSSSTLASRVAKQLDLGGGAMSIDAGDASALAALATASHLLRTGQSTMVVCVAGQRNMDLVRYRQLAREERVAASGPDPASAIVPAEGAVAFVLKRLDDARRDGDPIRAIIRGESAVADSNSAREAHDQALAAVLQQSAVDAGSLTLRDFPGVVEESGTTDPSVPPPLAAQIGDLQGGSAFAALLRTILALNAGRIDRLSNDSTPLFAGEGRAGGLGEVSSVMAAGDETQGGVAWSLVVEGTTPLPSRPMGTQAARNGAHLDLDTAERLVLAAAFEQTGYPRELLRLEDDLRVDLHLTPGQRSELIAAVAAAVGIAPDALEPQTQSPRHSERLADLVQRVVDASK